MSNNVCCPKCWTWADLGSRTTCTRCATPLVLADGRSVTQSPSIQPATSQQPTSRQPSGPPPAPPGAAEEPASPRRSRRFREVVAAVVLVAVVVAGAGGVLAFRFLHGSSDSLVSLVPDDTAVYLTFSLDPPAGQKLALQSLLGRFPALGEQSSTATIDTWLTQLLSGSGLTYNTDVSPWLGSEISFAVSASAISSLVPSTTARGTVPSAAFLIASTDDTKAGAALNKAKNGPSSASLTWTTSSDGGVTVTSAAGPGGGAFAITDHTVIIGSTTAAVDSVIDTVQGRHASLQSSSSYATVQSELPSDRLALAYVDVSAIISRLASSLSAVPGAAKQLNADRAYRGSGVALVASSDGIAVDGTMDFDPSRLTADQRASLAVSAHVNGSLGFVPPSAYGLLAIAGLRPTLHSAIATVAPPGSQLEQTLQQFGITGPGGLIDHLTGDAGIEVDKTPGSVMPAGALLIGTDSSAAAQSFLTTLVTSVCSQSAACDPASVTTQTDHGVTISSLPMAGLSGVEPSWAVSDGWVIIASSAAEVRAALDSHASGATVTGTSQFSAVAAHISTTNNGMFYLDVPAVVSAVRGTLPPQVRSELDNGAGAYLAHIRGIGLSSRSLSDHSTFTLFAGIQ